MFRKSIGGHYDIDKLEWFAQKARVPFSIQSHAVIEKPECFCMIIEFLVSLQTVVIKMLNSTVYTKKNHAISCDHLISLSRE